MAPQNSAYSSGYDTPLSELESIIPVHPTAARRPNYITVQSENTVYTDEHITTKYSYRGANVVVADGQFTVTPTVKPFEFQTVRKVSKTGYVLPSASSRALLINFVQVDVDRYGW